MQLRIRQLLRRLIATVWAVPAATCAGDADGAIAPTAAEGRGTKAPTTAGPSRAMLHDDALGPAVRGARDTCARPLKRSNLTTRHDGGDSCRSARGCLCGRVRLVGMMMQMMTMKVAMHIARSSTLAQHSTTAGGRASSGRETASRGTLPDRGTMMMVIDAIKSIPTLKRGGLARIAGRRIIARRRQQVAAGTARMMRMMMMDEKPMIKNSRGGIRLRLASDASSGRLARLTAIKRAMDAYDLFGGGRRRTTHLRVLGVPLVCKAVRVSRRAGGRNVRRITSRSVVSATR